MTQSVSCGRCATILLCSWILPGLGPGWPPPASVTCGQLWTTFSDPYCYTRTLSHVQSAASQSFLFKLSSGLLADMQAMLDNIFRPILLHPDHVTCPECSVSIFPLQALSWALESIVTILNTRWCCVNLYKTSFLS